MTRSLEANSGPSQAQRTAEGRVTRTPCRDNLLLIPTAQAQIAHERDRRIAESLQRVLLRTTPQEILPHVSTEAFYEAALREATVGGDSFDTFALSENRVALAVADASGKGLAAAERVAEIRFALRAFLREHGNLGRAITCLNDFVCSSQHLDKRDDSTFATLSLVVLNGATGEMECLCAGGEPPLVLRVRGRVEVAPICGPALGLAPNQGYATAPLHLEAGDAVLLVTDGITEGRSLNKAGPTGSRTGPLLGLEGLAQLAREAQNSTASLHQIGLSIFEGARRFASGSFQDDSCLLLAKRKI